MAFDEKTDGAKSKWGIQYTFGNTRRSLGIRPLLVTEGYCLVGVTGQVDEVSACRYGLTGLYSDHAQTTGRETGQVGDTPMRRDTNYFHGVGE